MVQFCYILLEFSNSWSHCGEMDMKSLL